MRGGSNLEHRGDSTLVQLTRSGDSRAFAVLWQRHASAGAAAAQQFASIADPEDLVSEAYLRILRAVQGGGGPTEAFRPYLYRTIRNVALGWIDKTSPISLEVAPQLEDPDGDPENLALERTITVRAFQTLPERWQTVLWYLEVEGLQPAEAAPLLELSPNAVSALAVRAREGLKKAWLQAHVSHLPVPPDCQWTTERMGQYTRGVLTPPARIRFDRHLKNCTRCSTLVDEVNNLSGWLAGILLPVTVGGAAGAGLLAQLRAGHPASVAAAKLGASRITVARSAVIAGAGIVAVAAIATGAWAVSLPPALPVSTPIAADPRRDAAPSAEPTAVPSPTAAAPTDPAPTDPPPPAPPASPADPAPVAPAPPVVAQPDVTAPAIPVLLDPAAGALTNNASPVFTGTGEPGAHVDVQVTDPSTGMLSTIAATTVDPAGNWMALTTVALPDGQHSISTSQVDPAGNRSPADVRVIVVDTVATPPQVDALPAQPMLFLPDITGSAEPGATVSLRDDLGAVLGTTLAGTDGRWTISLPDPARDGATLSATQTDPAGNVSSWSAATPQLIFDRPGIPSPAPDAAIPSTSGSTVVEIELDGHEGMQVQVFVDGVSTGNVHTLEAAPIVRVTPPLADGAHTVGVRYFDPGTGAAGSVYTVAFVIG